MKHIISCEARIFTRPTMLLPYEGFVCNYIIIVHRGNTLLQLPKKKVKDLTRHQPDFLGSDKMLKLGQIWLPGFSLICHSTPFGQVLVPSSSINLFLVIYSTQYTLQGINIYREEDCCTAQYLDHLNR